MVETEYIELDLDKIPFDESRGLCIVCKVRMGTKNLHDRCSDCAYRSRRI